MAAPVQKEGGFPVKKLRGGEGVVGRKQVEMCRKVLRGSAMDKDGAS